MIVFEVRSDRPIPASAYVMVGEVVSTLERLAGVLAPMPAAGEQNARTRTDHVGAGAVAVADPLLPTPPGR